MPYIRIINEDEATGSLADDYDFLRYAYTKNFGMGIMEIPTPKVFRASSLIPAYFRMGAAMFRGITRDGNYDRPYNAPVPVAFAMFAAARAGSCFY